MTGVQTCALPIYNRSHRQWQRVSTCFKVVSLGTWILQVWAIYIYIYIIFFFFFWETNTYKREREWGFSTGTGNGVLTQKSWFLLLYLIGFSRFIIPGLGDAGDRSFGTWNHPMCWPSRFLIVTPCNFDILNYLLSRIFFFSFFF